MKLKINFISSTALQTTQVRRAEGAQNVQAQNVQAQNIGFLNGSQFSKRPTIL